MMTLTIAMYGDFTCFLQGLYIFRIFYTFKPTTIQRLIVHARRSHAKKIFCAVAFFHVDDSSL